MPTKKTTAKTPAKSNHADNVADVDMTAAPDCLQPSGDNTGDNPTDTVPADTAPTDTAPTDTAPTDTSVAVPNEAWAAHVAKEEINAFKSQRPKIDGVKLAGKEGTFSRAHYDSEVKETVYSPFAEEGNAFPGIILAVRYQVRWKWSEDAIQQLYTNEFSAWRNEEIILTKRNGSDVETNSFEDYGAFKDEFCMVDKATDKVTSPFDLFVVLYTLVDGEVVKYRFKGSSRSAWFDYLNIKKSPSSTIITEFGVSDPIEMPAKEGEEASTYYHGTFNELEPVPADQQDGVLKALSDLDMYFASFKEVKTDAVDVQNTTAQDAIEKRIDDESLMLTE